MSILLASHKILLVRIINVKVQIHAQQSHDKALRMVLECFFFFLAYLYIYIFFHTVLHCIIFKGLKNILFSSSFLYDVLEEPVSTI